MRKIPKMKLWLGPECVWLDLSKYGAAAWQSADSFEFPRAACSEGGERDRENRGLFFFFLLHVISQD